MRELMVLFVCVCSLLACVRVNGQIDEMKGGMIVKEPIVAPAPVRTVKTKISVSGLNYLKQFGYLTMPSAKDSLVGQQVEYVVEKSLRTFQRFANLKVTGVLDNATVAQMGKSRCGMKDIESTDTARKRKRRYTLQGTKWNKNDLTWRVENENNDGLTRQQVEATMIEAFAKWSAITNMDFHQIGKDEGEPDIYVKFVSYYHDDPYPFDGPGNTLAHAFYPHNNKGLAGDLHFDDDEHYTLGTKKGKNLLWVATHEIGHSIGLEHSDNLDAIMYPWYRGSTGKDFDLTYDDTSGVQNLYGFRKKTLAPGVVTQAPPPTVKQPTQPAGPKKVCISKIQAVFSDPDTMLTYVINGDKVYTLGTDLGVKKGPDPIGKFFHHLDGKEVDAAYVDKDNQIVFFVGINYFVYRSVATGDLVDEGSIFTKFVGLPTNLRKIDAALLWKQNSRTYLFSGDYYYRYNDERNSIDPNYPRLIDFAWKGVPLGVDAVFTWIGNKATYFFKGDKYYRLDDFKVAVKPGYPQLIIDAWSKCSVTDKLGAQTGASSHLRANVMLLTVVVATICAKLLN